MSLMSPALAGGFFTTSSTKFTKYLNIPGNKIFHVIKVGIVCHRSYWSRDHELFCVLEWTVYLSDCNLAISICFHVFETAIIILSETHELPVWNNFLFRELQFHMIKNKISLHLWLLHKKIYKVRLATCLKKWYMCIVVTTISCRTDTFITCRKTSNSWTQKRY